MNLVALTGDLDDGGAEKLDDGCTERPRFEESILPGDDDRAMELGRRVLETTAQYSRESSPACREAAPKAAEELEVAIHAWIKELSCIGHGWREGHANSTLARARSVESRLHVCGEVAYRAHARIGACAACHSPDSKFHFCRLGQVVTGFPVGQSTEVERKNPLPFGQVSNTRCWILIQC